MKLKLDANGNAVLQDGKPVYVREDGTEVAFDAPATINTITRLTDESKGYKIRAQTAEEKLKVFEGIEDPAAAKKALETVANLDAGQLVTAGKVEEIKTAAKKAADDQVAAATKALNDQLVAQKADLAKAHGTIDELLIGGAFSGSKTIQEKFVVPSDMIRNTFGKNFKVEEGKVVAYDASGNKLYSRAKPGELADFEEGLELLVAAYPHKDQILKGNSNAGNGAHNEGGADKGGDKGGKSGDLTGTRAERTATIGTMFKDLPLS
jgi:hypothetical protein